MPPIPFALPDTVAPAAVAADNVSGSIAAFQQAAQQATVQSMAVAINMTMINGIKGAITKISPG